MFTITLGMCGVRSYAVSARYSETVQYSNQS